MFEKGFSTKGENRGVGLNNVKDILANRYKNVILNTSIEDEMFKQELWIRNDE
jgi:two-component system sensor histidine kinase AgrC